MTAWDMTLLFVNADGETLQIHPEDHIHVRRLIGPWSAPSYKPVMGYNADRDENRADRIETDDAKLLTLDCVITAADTVALHDVIAEMARLMRPWQSYRVPNTGWVYVARTNNIETADEWRKAVMPLMPDPPFLPRGANPSFEMPLQFAPLSSYWEGDERSTTLRAASAATWSTFTTTIDPGGTAHTFPTWEIDGPSAGSITGIKITNGATEYELELTGITLSAGHTLTIVTRPHELSVTRSDGTDYYSKRTASTYWFPLVADSQQLTFTKTGGTSQSAVRVLYRQRRQGL